MRVLVTGGAGFMGSWLVDILIEEGHEVVSVDDLSGGHMRNVNPKCKFIKMDLRDKNKVEKAVKNCDIIYHLAAYAAEGQSIFSPIEINDINITPMNNLLVSAVNNGVEKFVFTSSMAVYGDQKPPFNEELLREPEDPYGVSKAYCERMIEIFSKTYGFSYVILRPHNVYGPRQNIADPFRNVLGIWINRIMRNKRPIIFGDGLQTRAFSYIKDANPAILRAGFSKEAHGEIINVGSDEVTTIKDACRLVLECMDSDLKPFYQPGRPCEVKHAHSTTEKSEKILGYETKFSLERGIKEMVDWAQNLGPQEPTYKIPLEIKKKAPKVWLKKIQ